LPRKNRTEGLGELFPSREEKSSPIFGSSYVTAFKVNDILRSWSMFSLGGLKFLSCEPIPMLDRVFLARGLLSGSEGRGLI